MAVGSGIESKLQALEAVLPASGPVAFAPGNTAQPDAAMAPGMAR
jgi:hypothetical protein